LSSRRKEGCGLQVGLHSEKQDWLRRDIIRHVELTMMKPLHLWQKLAR
jgi:hypothetical protein